MSKLSFYTILFVMASIAVLASVMNGARLAPDTYYYWVWSQHLGWSYYDGPPMIAYSLRLLTTLFGNSENSIFSLGLISLGVTSFLLYRSAKLLFDDERVASLGVVIWVLSTGVIRHFVLGVTYDTVFIIFWAMTFYGFLKLVTTQKYRYYYFTGVSIGCMLLSKYPGILLCISLLLCCACYREYRFVFKAWHFYLALLLALVIFSPVLYWNSTHEWASFAYQLNHGFHSSAIPWKGLERYFVNTIVDLNVFFVFLVAIFLLYGREIFSTAKLALLATPTAVVWIFFLISAFNSIPASSWHMPCFFTGAILSAYYFLQLPMTRRQRACILGLFFIPTLGFIFVSRTSTFSSIPMWGESYGMSEMFSKVPARDYQGSILYSNDDYWLSSFASYFLQGHPMVYSTSLNAKQFYYWTQAAHPAKSGDSIVVISYYSKVHDEHFSNCQEIYHDEYEEKWAVYLSRCVYHNFSRLRPGDFNLNHPIRIW